MPTLKIVKTPSEALALTNCAIVNPADAKGDLVFIRRTFCLALKADGSVPAGSIGLSGCHRAWMQVSLNETLDVEVISQKQSHLPPIDSMMVEVRFLRKSIQNATPFDTEQMAEAMCRSFGGQPFALGQSLVMDFAGHTLSLLIKTVEPIGLLQAKSAIIKFYAAPDSAVKLVGPVKSTANPNALLQESFRFEDMGIGGLGEEFAMLFRRVFSSRLVPPTLARQFGLQHVKGVILFGPPGTGKTLIARQIGRMLNAREPKIVNGPEILNRFVGQSEENIRRLFEDAEREYAAKGDASQLHIIIFDELDAICRQRGGGRADTGVGDSIVNQLLAKMDGVEQLDNIVVVGMTNRKELIDEALLRPGRFEVHIAIGLPSEAGRLEILQIHTAAMQASGRLASDVDLVELAARARNFTGAELCGLIRAATSLAITRCIRVGTLAGLSDDIDSVQVCRADFVGAFEDVKAANGVSEGEFAACAPYGYIPFSPALTDLLSECAMTVRQVQSGKTSLCTLLLYGTASALQLFLFFLGAPGTGKTALAAKIASESDFQYAKLITSYSMLGMSEAARVAHIHKVFADAARSPDAVIVLDALEKLIEFVPIGPRFAMSILVTLIDLLTTRPPSGRLLVIATTSRPDILAELGAGDCFDQRLHVAPLHAIEEARVVLEHASRESFTLGGPLVRSADIPDILRALSSTTFSIPIKRFLQMLGHASMASDDAVQGFLNQL